MGKLRDTVHNIFVTEIGMGPEYFTDELTYNSVPEWDSQGHMLLVLALEEKFDLHFEPDEVVGMTSVQKIFDLLKSRGLAD
jgi:acyl carrier protein